MRTIGQVEAQLKAKVSEVLKELGIPTSGLQAEVRIHGESRKKRQSASFETSWSPDRDSIQITFEVISEQSQATSQPTERPGSTPVPKPKSGSVSDPVSDLIKALDRAESQPGYKFVALKWFRDAALPAEDFAWANTDSIRDVLRDCIDKRLILTSKVPNPKSPQFPVTAIRLNRLMPDVKAILGTQDEGTPDFQPVPIRGESLSATVLRERR
ncbi:MAG TPA: hypothetical protein VJV74_00025 [Terriglobia bacterium]|nr:hypothetical protein [Terriglobia bacterium]